MKNRRNYYRILQIQPDASIEVIRASYKALMRDLKAHPDLGGDLWNAQILNVAYTVLQNSDKRQEYDRALFECYTKQPLREPLTGKPPVISLFCPFCKRPMAREATPDEMCPTCRSPLNNNFDEFTHQACRRALPRMKKSGKFYYYTTWPQKGKQGDLVDISKEGFRFQGLEKVTIDTFIKISSPMLRGVAKINNVYKLHKNGQKYYSMGAKFVSVSFRDPRGGFYNDKV